MRFKLFRRSRSVAAAALPALPATLDPPAPAPAPAAADGASLDAVKADVLGAIGAVGDAVTRTQHDVAAACADLDRIRSEIAALAEAAEAAAGRTAGLATSTEALAGSAGRITAAMGEAGGHLDAADTRSQEARALVAALSRGSREIAGIVEAIAAVARQTNLLALNATIEAVRAGEAGRGFAVVAGEVKALSVQTARAADEIRARIAALGDSAGAADTAIETMSAAVAEVRPAFGAVRHEVEAQSGAAAEVAARAAEASRFVGWVSTRAAEVGAETGTAAARVLAAGEGSHAAAGMAADLGARFVAVVRQSALGDRRRQDRYPEERSVRLADGRTTRTVDLGTGGALVASLDGAPPATGTRLALEVAGIGPLAARVVATSALGLHLAFDLDPAARERVEAAMAEIAAGYGPLIALAQRVAGEVGAAFAQALATGRLSEESLFDVDYRPIAGTDPLQHLTRAVPVLEDLLPGLIEPPLSADQRMVFCIAVDRNGYIPVHNQRVSQVQRPGEPTWNAANARNRRIFDDRAGITAARSMRPFTVQAYRREMGGHSVVVREVDAPIRVAGRHWGGLRTAYRL